MHNAAIRAMSPLVVRPAAQATTLVNLLRQRGHRPLASPLLEILPGSDLPLLPTLLAQADLVIIISINAVHFTHNKLLKIAMSWPITTYIAVGTATANALNKVGINAITPTTHNSEGVIALPDLQQIAGKRIVILRGNGGRNLIADTLTERDALVHYCDVYQRHYPPFNGELLVQHWQKAEIDSLLITSGELLRRLLELTPQYQLPWLLSCLLVVPSHRIAKMASAAGFTHIEIAQGASNNALMVALERKTS